MSFATVIRTERLTATQQEDGRWQIKGRGIKPGLYSSAELQGFLNSRPNGRKQRSNAGTLSSPRLRKQ